ncbi:unnamed protein product [Agarophyton chilense]
MFHDLNICIPPAAQQSALQTLYKLGFHVVAFSTVVSNVSKLTDGHLPPRHKLSVESLSPPGARTIKVLQRITLVINDANQLPTLNSSILSAYDLVAVMPTSEKLLQQCMRFDIDIISIPLNARLHFFIKRPHVHVALDKGIIFEISYAHGLRDLVSRRNLVANASALSSTTGGRHIILSSGAATQMELRGTHDVINLGVLFGITHEHAYNSVTRNAIATVQHGEFRAKYHKGIVRVIETKEQQETSMQPETSN